MRPTCEACSADGVVDPLPGLPVFGPYAHLSNGHFAYSIVQVRPFFAFLGRGWWVKTKWSRFLLDSCQEVVALQNAVDKIPLSVPLSHLSAIFCSMMQTIILICGTWVTHTLYFEDMLMIHRQVDSSDFNSNLINSLQC
jgi:hypothetical protein